MAKKKMGRPATGTHPQHTYRMPDEDYQRLKDVSELSGIPVQEIVRKGAMAVAELVLCSMGVDKYKGEPRNESQPEILERLTTFANAAKCKSISGQNTRG